MARTITELFDDFDGPAGVARAIGKSTEHATTMRRRRSIPVQYWERLLRAAHERGLDLDEAALIRMHREAKEERAA